MTRTTFKPLRHILAACAFAALAVQPAAAQQSTTVLRNLDQTLEACGASAGNPDVASRFQTGANALAVDAIEIHWQDDTAGASAHRVGIFAHDAGTGRPGAQVGSTWLGHTSNAIGSGQVTFTDTSGNNHTIALQANTDYWVVLRVAPGGTPSCTGSNSFFAEPTAGNPSLLREGVVGNIGGAWPNYGSTWTLAYGLSAIIGAEPGPGPGPNPGPNPGPGNPGVVQSVPTLTEWGVLVLSAVLIGGGLLATRRQHGG